MKAKKENVAGSRPVLYPALAQGKQWVRTHSRIRMRRPSNHKVPGSVVSNNRAEYKRIADKGTASKAGLKHQHEDAEDINHEDADRNQSMTISQVRS